MNYSRILKLVFPPLATIQYLNDPSLSESDKRRLKVPSMEQYCSSLKDGILAQYDSALIREVLENKLEGLQCESYLSEALAKNYQFNDFRISFMLTASSNGKASIKRFSCIDEFCWNVIEVLLTPFNYGKTAATNVTNLVFENPGKGDEFLAVSAVRYHEVKGKSSIVTPSLNSLIEFYLVIQAVKSTSDSYQLIDAFEQSGFNHYSRLNIRLKPQIIILNESDENLIMP